MVYAGVKFDQSDHQHRVTLHGGKSWMTLPVEKEQRNAMIKDVQLAKDHPATLIKMGKTIRQHFVNKKHPFGRRLLDLVDVLESGTVWESMLDVNMATFVAMARAVTDTLPKIDVDVEVREGYKVEKLDRCLEQYSEGRPLRYLFGGAGLDYMGFHSLKFPKECMVQRMDGVQSPDSMLQEIAMVEDLASYVDQASHWESASGQSFSFVKKGK